MEKRMLHLQGLERLAEAIRQRERAAFVLIVDVGSPARPKPRTYQDTTHRIPRIRD